MRGDLPDEVAYSSTHESLIREYLDGESLRLSRGKPDGLFDQYRESLQRQSLLGEDTLEVSGAPTLEENPSSVLAALTMDTSTAAMLEGDLPNLVLWDSHSNNRFAHERASSVHWMSIQKSASQGLPPSPLPSHEQAAPAALAVQESLLSGRGLSCRS
jgi:hypothetical protein